MMVTGSTRAIKIFFSYAHEDKGRREELEKHLGALRRSGKIVTWYDRDIQAGTQWEQEIDTHLNSADLILLLISHHFIDSDYCYGIEMKRALERHRAGTARLIPVVLSPVDWEETPISTLQALPIGGKPVTQWRDRNVAFVNVVQGIREVVKTILVQQEAAYGAITERSQQTIDTHEAVKLFHHLMEPEHHFRILYLIGQANMGKSHLLTKVFPIIVEHKYHARHILIDLRNTPISSVPDILNTVCAQLGPQNCSNYYHAYQKLMGESSSGITRLLTDFSYLDTSPTAYSDIQKRDDRLTTQFMLDLSGLQDKPVVFFFDSFDQATAQMQIWLTTSFLMKVSLLPYVRVVVAGRTLPEVPGGYVDLHQVHQLYPVREEAEYLAYCQNTQVKLAEQEIVAAARDCNYTPGMFVNYLFTKLVQQKV
ncbi:MAG TPA: toll/interleukin-1 receptor domain-containing protein [Ktedonobacteraceae bacterium]|nr:toll/interleukin-1 receptor domain-containing protein [Ktedonobacteraceae bacterium]